MVRAFFAHAAPCGAAGMRVYEPGRESQVFDHIRAVNPGPLPDSEMLHIYERIIDVMRSLQKKDGGSVQPEA